MSKLVIHIGYPKTGTTSIQNGLFKTLHQNNDINYLGRSSISSKNVNSTDNQIRRYLFLNEDISKNIFDINAQKVNLLSDEELTSPFSYMELKYGAKKKPCSFADKLFNLTKSFPELDVQIVLVLRKQSDLIYSWYTQMYRYFCNGDESIVSDHVFKDDRLNSTYFETYRFNEIAATYADVFGKDKIHFLFFEDFKNKSISYGKFWADILNVDEKKVSSSLFSYHFNKKKKVGSDSIAEFNSGELLLQKTTRLVPIKFKYFLKYLGLTNLVLYILKKTKLSKQKSKRLNSFTPQEEILIKNAFLESNLALVQNFDVSKKKLFEFGYI